MAKSGTEIQVGDLFSFEDNAGFTYLDFVIEVDVAGFPKTKNSNCLIAEFYEKRKIRIYMGTLLNSHLTSSCIKLSGTE